jgi:hypothetical protein
MQQQQQQQVVSLPRPRPLPTMCRENEGSCVQQPVERQARSLTHPLVLLPFLAAVPSDRCCQGLPPGKNGMPCHMETIWAPTVGHPGRVTLAKAWQGGAAPCSCCWGVCRPPGQRLSTPWSIPLTGQTDSQCRRYACIQWSGTRDAGGTPGARCAVQVSPGLRGPAGYGCIAKCEGVGRGRG